MSYIPKFPMERDKVVSDKEKVLAKWPNASIMEYDGEYFAINNGCYLGDGYSEPEAWADAARRLEEGK